VVRGARRGSVAVPASRLTRTVPLAKGAPPPQRTPRTYVYGSYVDEVLCYTTGQGANGT
jgi:hypothetical protein